MVDLIANRWLLFLLFLEEFSSSLSKAHTNLDVLFFFIYSMQLLTVVESYRFSQVFFKVADEDILE